LIAVVTGASRGGGRGIALALGGLGATVYVTGRTRAGETGLGGLPGTIDETAGEVTARGGAGIAVRVDHTVDTEAEALFARVAAEHGRLDVLVANAWGGYEQDDAFDAPFWEQPLTRFDRMWAAGVRSTYVACIHAARLMLPARRGLLVATTLHAGPDDWSLEREGPISVPYETAKVAVNRTLFGMAHNLRPHGVAAVAVAPSWMRTEAVLRDNPPPPARLGETHSVDYLGRVVAALACDPDPMRHTGRLYRAVDLGREYGLEPD
jgi:NAD(P)-dependent dehydrogenase (short-subunit alcohol dehydrogenase family)